MRLHIIFDAYYMYYRYKYLIEAGKMRQLSTRLSEDKLENYNKFRAEYGLDPVAEDMDTTYIYYPIKSIESELHKYDTDKIDLTVSICFDAKSRRKDNNSTYKSNRIGKLNTLDMFNINLIYAVFGQLYNVYREEGVEADDLIYTLSHKFTDYDKIIIYSPDADILVNLSDNISVMRYKTSLKSHVLFTPSNFEELMSKEYKCKMPYNCIVLYKALCGDKSDVIAGIKGFGPKAFDRLITKLEHDEVAFNTLTNWRNVESIIKEYKEDIAGKSEDKIDQALDSLSMVRPIEGLELSEPIEIDRKVLLQRKREVYSNFLGFKL